MTPQEQYWKQLANSATDFINTLSADNIRGSSQQQRYREWLEIYKQKPVIEEAEDGVSADSQGYPGEKPAELPALPTRDEAIDWVIGMDLALLM